MYILMYTTLFDFLISPSEIIFVISNKINTEHVVNIIIRFNMEINYTKDIH